jgi:hypothetical protein
MRCIVDFNTEWNKHSASRSLYFNSDASVYEYIHLSAKLADSDEQMQGLLH